MRVAIVTNATDWPTRGNHTTIWRWLDHVRDAELTPIRADGQCDLDPVPDVIHGYHARNGGIAARALARRYGRPLVVSLGGTDLLSLTEGSDEILSVLRAAACVTGAFESFRAMLPADVSYTTVPRGVVIPDRVVPRAPDGMLRVLLPAGLRPVKDPLLAVEMATALVERGLSLQLSIVGPQLDGDYARQVLDRAAGLPYVTVGELAPESMHAAYVDADVVWNTSRFEGGSNALLEAGAHGCARFARDVVGNRDTVEPHELFEAGDMDAIERFHRGLLDETLQQREERVREVRARLRENNDPCEEARSLQRVWAAASGAD